LHPFRLTPNLLPAPSYNPGNYNIDSFRFIKEANCCNIYRENQLLQDFRLTDLSATATVHASVDTSDYNIAHIVFIEIIHFTGGTFGITIKLHDYWGMRGYLFSADHTRHNANGNLHFEQVFYQKDW